MSRLKTYPTLRDVPKRDDFSIRARIPGGEWADLTVYEVKVDMHNVRHASMAYFDMEGSVEIEVVCCYTTVQSVAIRPRSFEIPFEQRGSKISFILEQPRMLSIEVNGDRFRNLFLFANPIEENAPRMDDPDVLVVKPGIHRIEHILRPATQASGENNWKEPSVIYFAPGMHFIEETIFRIPSGKTVYIDGGAAVVGSLVCESVQNVTISGRGMIYLSDFHRFSAFRGIRIMNSQFVSVEGIMTVDVPHYSIYIGGSDHVRVRNFKSFSTRGWSDGIDMMASSNIDIDNIFMRNSDDCIAIYGSRWDYHGDSRNIKVRNAVLWADVAHPIMIGIHGNHRGSGDTIENILFENIDILEHHEPQPNYWGAMAINAGDNNVVRNVTFGGIRVEQFELGQLFDIRVVWNPDYNPIPGGRIENILFRNIDYMGGTPNPSRIYGYDAERIVDGVTFENVRIGGELVTGTNSSDFDINPFTNNIRFITTQKNES